MPPSSPVTLLRLRVDLKKRASPAKAKLLARFFKTGPGEYGEGDVFIGVMVPDTRQVARQYSGLILPETKKLLHSKIHEERLCAILILIEKYRKADDRLKEDIYNFYLTNTGFINNWDLIDLSAPQIIGNFLQDKSKAKLYQLAKSKSLWERRISILATFNFIYRGQPKETLKIAKLLLNDKHDLIHKAVGWMLREVGKRCSQKTLEDFLAPYYKKMPRTMLRYAIERLPPGKRNAYRQGIV